MYKNIDSIGLYRGVHLHYEINRIRGSTMSDQPSPEWNIAPHCTSTLRRLQIPFRATATTALAIPLFPAQCPSAATGKQLPLIPRIVSIPLYRRYRPTTAYIGDVHLHYKIYRIRFSTMAMGDQPLKGTSRHTARAPCDVLWHRPIKSHPNNCPCDTSDTIITKTRIHRFYRPICLGYT